MINKFKDNASVDPNIIYSNSYLIDTDLGYNNNLSLGFMNEFKINTSVSGSQSAPTSLLTNSEHFNYPHFNAHLDYVQCIQPAEDSFGSSCSSGTKLSYPLSHEPLHSSYLKSGGQSIDSYFCSSDNALLKNEMNENDNSIEDDTKRNRSRGRGGNNVARKRHVNQENNDDGRSSINNGTFSSNNSTSRGKHGKALARHPFIPSYMDPNNGPHLCVVCKHNASGFHYRVMACEGCKGFFRRTVQNNLMYSCKFNKKCEIQPHNRAQCQECRWRKCLEVGMAKDLVLSEEARRAKKDLIASNRAKKLSSERSSNKGSNEFKGPVSPFNNDKQNFLISEVDERAISQIKRAFEETDVTKTEVSMGFEDRNLIQILQCVVDHHVTSLIIKCDIVDDSNIESARFNFRDEFNILTIIVQPILRRVISFAFLLPNFSELSFNDQVVLLKTSCFEIICLRNYINYNRHSEVLKLGDDFLVTKDNVKLSKLIEPSYAFVRRISSLAMDNVEISLMAALALLSCDRLGLEDIGKVESLQDDVLRLIDYYMKVNSYDNTHRQSELYATILPELRSSTSWHSQILINSHESIVDRLLPEIRAIYHFSESSSPQMTAICTTSSTSDQRPHYDTNTKYLNYPYVSHAMPPLYPCVEQRQPSVAANVLSSVHLGNHSGQSSFTELLINASSDTEASDLSMADNYITQESSAPSLANYAPVTTLNQSTQDNTDPVFDFTTDLI